MDFIDYREKLGIGFNDRELEDMFFNRIFNVLDALYDMNNQISENEYFHFCRYTGYPMQHGITAGEGWGIILQILHKNISSVREFLPYYMFMINCQEDTEHKSWTKEKLKNLVRNCLIESHIPCEVYEENGNYFVFPKGAKELDEALVSEPLEWLKNYPLAHKTYCIALKQYSEGIYIRDVADNFRKALETFLQEFLCNTKNLENNKNEICKYLGEQGVDAGISGLFQPLINAYKNINDRIAKHNDSVDEKLLEFLLYQTGLLIRMVLSVKEKEENRIEKT